MLPLNYLHLYICSCAHETSLEINAILYFYSSYKKRPIFRGQIWTIEKHECAAGDSSVLCLHFVLKEAVMLDFVEHKEKVLVTPFTDHTGFLRAGIESFILSLSTNI